MPWFKVTFDRTQACTALIKAENEEEAEQIVDKGEFRESSVTIDRDLTVITVWNTEEA